MTNSTPGTLLVICMSALMLASAAAADGSKLASDFDKAAKKVADEHAKVAKWADDKGLWSRGYLQWDNCLELDPNNKKARERLGYEKTSTGDWVRVRGSDPKKVDEVAEDQRAALERECDTRWLDVKTKALKEFEKILTQAVKDGDSDFKQKVAKLIRRYDPFHKGAIAALGMEIDENGRPVEPLRDPEKEADKPAQPSESSPEGTEPPPVGRGSNRKADLPVVVPEGTNHPWSVSTQIPFKCAESRHHCLLAPEMELDHMKALLDVAEQMRTRFYERYLIPNDVEFYGRKITFLMLADREQHKIFCDKQYRDDTSESHIEFVMNQSGGGTYPKYFGAWVHSKGEAVEKDWIVHYGTHLVTSTFNPGLPTWMDEAVCYEQSIGIQSTAWTSCINDQMTGDRAKDWADPINWRELIRDLVRLGTDTPFASIVGYTPNEINPKIAAKCWSFLTWLLDTQGAKVYSMLGNLRGEPEGQSAVFTAVFGKSLEDLETDWRKYVKDTY